MWDWTNKNCIIGRCCFNLGNLERERNKEGGGRVTLERREEREKKSRRYLECVHMLLCSYLMGQMLTYALRVRSA